VNSRLQDYQIVTAALWQEIRSGKVLNLANFLTLSRLVLVLPAITLLPKRTLLSDVALLLILSIAVITDFLDGQLARKLNQLTHFGKILDPLVDKVAAGIMLVLLHLYRDLPLWAVLFFIFKDFVIMTGGYMVIRDNKKVPAPGYWGAITVTLLVIATGFYVFELNIIGLIALLVAMAFALWSVIDYGRRIM